MLELNNDIFEQHLKDGKTFIVDFYADWCRACTVMLPVVEEISQSYANVPFYKVNIDNHPELTEKAKIKAIPMLLVYADGKMKGFVYGSNPKNVMENKINTMVQQ